MNLEDYKPGHIPEYLLKLEDRWLLSRLSTVSREVTEALEQYRFADAARTLYAFAWNDFCDYYVEITKARFAQSPGAQVTDTAATRAALQFGSGVGDASDSSRTVA